MTVGNECHVAKLLAGLLGRGVTLRDDSHARNLAKFREKLVELVLRDGRAKVFNDEVAVLRKFSPDAERRRLLVSGNGPCDLGWLNPHGYMSHQSATNLDLWQGLDKSTSLRICKDHFCDTPLTVENDLIDRAEARQVPMEVALRNRFSNVIVRNLVRVPAQHESAVDNVLRRHKLLFSLGLALRWQLVPLELVVRTASLEIDHGFVSCLMQVEQDKAIATILTGLEVSRNLHTANRGRVQLAVLLGEVSFQLVLCHVDRDPLHIQVAVLVPIRADWLSSLRALAELIIKTEHAQLPAVEREILELLDGSVALLA